MGAEVLKPNDGGAVVVVACAPKPNDGTLVWGVPNATLAWGAPNVGALAWGAPNVGAFV